MAILSTPQPPLPLLPPPLLYHHHLSPLTITFTTSISLLPPTSQAQYYTTTTLPPHLFSHHLGRRTSVPGAPHRESVMFGAYPTLPYPFPSHCHKPRHTPRTCACITNTLQALHICEPPLRKKEPVYNHTLQIPISTMRAIAPCILLTSMGRSPHRDVIGNDDNVRS